MVSVHIKNITSLVIRDLQAQTKPFSSQPALPGPSAQSLEEGQEARVGEMVQAPATAWTRPQKLMATASGVGEDVREAGILRPHV